MTAASGADRLAHAGDIDPDLSAGRSTLGSMTTRPPRPSVFWTIVLIVVLDWRVGRLTRAWAWIRRATDGRL